MTHLPERVHFPVTNVEADWEAEDNKAQWIFAALKLDRGNSFLFNSSSYTYMSEEGGNFYVRSCIDHAIFEIMSPKTLMRLSRR